MSSPQEKVKEPTAPAEFRHCEKRTVLSSDQKHEADVDRPVDVKTAAKFLGVSPSLVYAWVERKRIPHYRMMGRSIRFRLSELEEWLKQFKVNGGIDE